MANVNGSAADLVVADVVKDFLELLAAREPDAACDLLDEDIVYMNVSLPTIRGRERTRRIMKSAFGRKGAAFEVYFHHVGVDGITVLTERTDVLIMGPVRIQIWVWGHFDVVGGRIVLWKDYFDWSNVIVATVRGLVGAVIPALRPKPPAGPFV